MNMLRFIMTVLFVSTVISDDIGAFPIHRNIRKSISSKKSKSISSISSKKPNLMNKRNCNLNCDYENTRLVEFELEEYTRNTNKFKYVFNTTTLNDMKISLYLTSDICKFYCNYSKHISYLYDNSYYNIKEIEFDDTPSSFVGNCNYLFLNSNVSNYNCFISFMNHTIPKFPLLFKTSDTTITSSTMLETFTTQCPTFDCKNIFINITTNNSQGNISGNSQSSGSSSSSSGGNINAIIAVAGALCLMGIAMFIANKRRNNKKNVIKPMNKKFKVQEYQEYQQTSSQIDLENPDYLEPTKYNETNKNNNSYEYEAPTPPIDSKCSDYLEPTKYNKTNQKIYEQIKDNQKYAFVNQEETSCDNVYDMGNNNVEEETSCDNVYDMGNNNVEETSCDNVYDMGNNNVDEDNTLYDYADDNVEYETASNIVTDYLKVMPNNNNKS